MREGLEGNLCRCTGYQNIVRAVRHATRVESAKRSRSTTVQPTRPARRIRAVTRSTSAARIAD